MFDRRRRRTARLPELALCRERVLWPVHLVQVKMQQNNDCLMFTAADPLTIGWLVGCLAFSLQIHLCGILGAKNRGMRLLNNFRGKIPHYSFIHSFFFISGWRPYTQQVKTVKTRQHRKVLWHNGCPSHNLLHLTLTHDLDIDNKRGEGMQQWRT